MESFNILGDADNKAIGESVASQLPGREMGPADAYRHVLLSAELTRQYGPGWATAGLMDHELDPSAGTDNGLDYWNNAIGLAIGNHVRKQGGDWTDVVRLSRDIMTQSLAGETLHGLERRWEKMPAVKGLAKFYHESPLREGGTLTPPFEIWRERFNQTEPFFVREGHEVKLDGGALTTSPVAINSPRAWRKNPALLDPQGGILIDEAGQTLRKANTQSNWPDAKGAWARGDGFLYEPGNAAPPLLGDLTQPAADPAPKDGKRSGFPVGEFFDGISDAERRARRLYDRTYQR